MVIQLEKIEITRGNKQGCPLSALNFNLIVEIIAQKLKQHPDIHGISINGVTKLLSQFADDLWTVTKYSQNAIDTQIRLFKQFQNYTGLSINYDKTEIMRLGSLENTDAQCYSSLPLKWSDGPIKILGIWVGNDIDKAAQYNYHLAVQKAEQICQKWSNRILTLYGKILIINVLVLSQFIYKLRCLPSPNDDICKTLKAIILDYIWLGGKAKIAYSKLVQDYEQGGVKLMDLKIKDQVIKACDLYNTCNTQDPFLRNVLRYCIPINTKILLRVNLNSKDFKKITKYRFFKDMVNCWAKINYVYPPLNAAELGEQIIWFNSNVKLLGQMLYYPSLCESDVSQVKHFYSKQSKTWYPYNYFVSKYGFF